jgi:hypothetical protein
MHDTIGAVGLPAAADPRKADREGESRGAMRHQPAAIAEDRINRPPFILRLICRLIPDA